MMLRRQLERYGKWAVVIVAFAAVAVVAGSYIAVKQRLQTPLQDRYEVQVELTSGQALTPGLGQPVNVVGVRVGDVTGVRLREGRALVTLAIDPGRLPRVHADASAALEPNTPLKDMQIELSPGTPSAGELPAGTPIAAARTEVPVDVDEIARALDADTRSYFTALVAALDEGTAGRGVDLRAALKALGPTARQAGRITSLLADRRARIRRLVRNLSAVAAAAGGKDEELAELVDSGNATLGALASEDAALRESVAKLPGALRQLRGSLGRAGTLADELGPTLSSLLPAARGLEPALKGADRLLAQDLPLRSFVRDAQPLAASLGPAVRDIRGITPDLAQSFQVLSYVSNELMHNPEGDDEGFLFWTAWFFHNASSMLSTQDAHGASWRGLTLLSCSSIAAQPGLAPALHTLLDALVACPGKEG